MRYLDTGSRDPDQCLAKWLEFVLSEDVEEIRLQSGFFSANALGIFVPALEKSRKEDLPVRVLVGSNDGLTLRDDVAALLGLIGIPRKNGSLGVVRFAGAYFHPKTYHFRRPDGSEAAFVGSANLSMNGLALHVEAGIALDTREGDPIPQTALIAKAIDQWFEKGQEGLTLINELASLDNLVKGGLLAITPPPSPAKTTVPPGSSQASIPHLKRLVSLPKFAGTPMHEPADGDDAEATVPAAQLSQSPAAPISSQLPSAPKKGFKQYFMFDPSATGPTSGALALTGTSLPGGAVGLVLKLNKDSARHFVGAGGTANVSLPIATVHTLRFGVYGTYGRPRAEFALRARYLADNQSLNMGTMETNVMGYGVDPAEPGHSDIRMVLPKGIADVLPSLQQLNLPVPKAGELALLEWPTPATPSFRLTFLSNGSQKALEAAQLFTSASTSNAIVGRGACWLPNGVSPAW